MQDYGLLRSVLQLINLCENMEEVRDLVECVLTEAQEQASAK
jgi:hypothetical protein